MSYLRKNKVKTPTVYDQHPNAGSNAPENPAYVNPQTMPGAAIAQSLDRIFNKNKADIAAQKAQQAQQAAQLRATNYSNTLTDPNEKSAFNYGGMDALKAQWAHTMALRQQTRAENDSNVKNSAITNNPINQIGRQMAQAFKNPTPENQQKLNMMIQAHGKIKAAMDNEKEINKIPHSMMPDSFDTKYFRENVYQPLFDKWAKEKADLLKSNPGADAVLDNGQPIPGSDLGNLVQKQKAELAKVIATDSPFSGLGDTAQKDINNTVMNYYNSPPDQKQIKDASKNGSPIIVPMGRWDGKGPRVPMPPTGQLVDSLTMNPQQLKEKWGDAYKGPSEEPKAPLPEYLQRPESILGGQDNAENNQTTAQPAEDDSSDNTGA